MIKQRSYATREDAVLFAEVLVAMHQDWSLLGERGTNPVRSFAGFREIRASIYISLAEYPFIVSTRKTADEHGPVCICEIDAIAGIAEYTSKIFELWNRDLNQSFDGSKKRLISDSVNVCGGRCWAGSSLWSIRHRRQERAIRDSGSASASWLAADKTRATWFEASILAIRTSPPCSYFAKVTYRKYKSSGRT